MTTPTSMKRNYLVLTAIAIVLSLTFFGCKKDPQETLTPKITDDNVEVTATTATFTWTVDWPGKKISVVEVSENEDMSQAVRFGSEEELNKNTFLVTATDLKPATKYYYHFLVWNHSYVGNEFVLGTKWFTTDSDLPKVTTLPVSEVTWTTALGGGNVTDDCGSEVTERGICWSERPKPTLGDEHKANGSGTGLFSVLMEDLEPNRTYYVRAYAKNEKGVSYGEDESFITNETLLPEVTTAEVTDIAWRTAVGGGEVTNENGAEVTERGICWSTEHNPTTSNYNAHSGTGLGTFSINMEGLTAGTTYYVRAYARNNAGLKYGNEVTFTTEAPIAPTVVTWNVTQITYNTATGGGNVTSDGGSSVTEYGICWSKEHNPVYEGTHLTIGSGTGSFTGQMSGLEDGTKYYVRAYAKNGVDISYGDEKSFTTLTIVEPSVTTISVNNVEWTSATVKGKVTNNGGTNIIQQGVCWNTTGNPTINDHCVQGSLGSSTFTIDLQNLAPGTKYYVKAYAKNSKKVGYGNLMYFETKQLSAPVVTTEDVTVVSQRRAKGNGKVTSTGGSEIIEKGFCWGLEANPGFDGSHVVSSSTGTSFNAFMEGLEPNTVYHVRAYAKNQEGTGWGGDKTFTTSPIQAPIVSIVNVTHGAHQATINCEVLGDGGADIIERGVCWTTNSTQLPTIEDNVIVADGAELGTYSVQMTVDPETTYYIRAYAKNGIAPEGYSIYSTFTAYPEWFDILVQGDWGCSFTENGHNRVRYLTLWDDGSINYYVYDDDDMDFEVDVYGTFDLSGSTMFADYDDVTVWNSNGTNHEYYHGFTNEQPITVTYQIISCDMNELVVKESLENKTWHFRPGEKKRTNPLKGRK